MNIADKQQMNITAASPMETADAEQVRDPYDCSIVIAPGALPYEADRESYTLNREAALKGSQQIKP